MGEVPALSDAPTAAEGVRITRITGELVLRQRERARAQVMPPADVVAEAAPYRVGPRDILTITVWDHPELTIPAGEFRDAELQGHRVSEDGTLFYPYVGIVHAGGRTIEEIRRELTRELGRYINNPQLDVRIAAFRSQRVHVVGEVRNPGVVPLTDIPLNVAEAVSQVGGITPEADLRSVTVTRGAKVIQVDLLGLYERGDAAQNFLLQDGDVLSIPDRAANKVFVMGEVLRPAAVQMRRRGMTLAEALSEAGGPSQITANPRRIYVIRSGREEESEVFHLDAGAADALLLADAFELAPRDIVYVDTAGISRWNRFITQILPSAAFLRLGQEVWEAD